MNAFTPLFRVIAIAVLLCCSTGVPVSAQGTGAPDVQIKDKALSVNLKDVPLRSVVDSLKEKGNISFTADQALLDEKVSVQFKGLSLEDGIKRILSQMNYVLIFGKEGQVSGVRVLGKKSAVSGSDRSAPVQQTSVQETGKTNRASTAEANKGDSSPPIGSSAFRPSPKAPVEVARQPIDISSEKDSEEQYKSNEQAGRLGWGAPQAGGSLGNSTPLSVPLPRGTTPEGDSIVRNATPPGGTVKVSPAEAQEMKPAATATSGLPGGEPKATAKEVEALNVKRNVDAPGRGQVMSPDGGN
jgi:hypothetical protein